MRLGHPGRWAFASAVLLLCAILVVAFISDGYRTVPARRPPTAGPAVPSSPKVKAKAPQRHERAKATHGTGSAKRKRTAKPSRHSAPKAAKHATPTPPHTSTAPKAPSRPSRPARRKPRPQAPSTPTPAPAPAPAPAPQPTPAPAPVPVVPQVLNRVCTTLAPLVQCPVNP